MVEFSTLSIIHNHLTRSDNIPRHDKQSSHSPAENNLDPFYLSHLTVCHRKSFRRTVPDSGFPWAKNTPPSACFLLYFCSLAVSFVAPMTFWSQLGSRSDSNSHRSIIDLWPQLFWFIYELFLEHGVPDGSWCLSQKSNNKASFCSDLADCSLQSTPSWFLWHVIMWVLRCFPPCCNMQSHSCN